MPVGIELAGVLAGGEEKLFAAAQHGFLQGGEQHMAAVRGIDHQQAVVLAGIAAQNAAGGVIAPAVGEQPFLAQSPSGVLAGGLVETEPHGALLAGACAPGGRQGGAVAATNRRGVPRGGTPKRKEGWRPLWRRAAWLR